MPIRPRRWTERPPPGLLVERALFSAPVPREHPPPEAHRNPGRSRSGPELSPASVRSNGTLREVSTFCGYDSRFCNSRHHKGDKFYFDGAGNLLTELSPKKVCLYALHSASLLVFTANEMIYAGVDPNTIKFRRANCFDVGLECGGWGRIVLELSVERRPQPALASVPATRSTFGGHD